MSVSPSARAISECGSPSTSSTASTKGPNCWRMYAARSSPVAGWGKERPTKRNFVVGALGEDKPHRLGKLDHAFPRLKPAQVGYPACLRREGERQETCRRVKDVRDVGEPLRLEIPP